MSTLHSPPCSPQLGFEAYIGARIEQTFTGIAVHLVVEMLLDPQWADPILRGSTRAVFKEASHALSAFALAKDAAGAGGTLTAEALDTAKVHAALCRAHIGKAQAALQAHRSEPHFGARPPVAVAAYEELHGAQRAFAAHLDVFVYAASRLVTEHLGKDDATSLLLKLTARLARQASACDACWSGEYLDEFERYAEPIDALTTFQACGLLRREMAAAWVAHLKTDASQRGRTEINRQSSALLASLAAVALAAMSDDLRLAGSSLDKIVAQWPWVWPAIEGGARRLAGKAVAAG